MQNTKDTFYETMQDRLAALNPARTVVVRGLVRPGVLVQENELISAMVPLDTFRLEWLAIELVMDGPMPLLALTCSIAYATEGSVEKGGMDRGRLLAAMDAELQTVLRNEPRAILKKNYSAAGFGASAVPMGTSLFWADPSFGVATTEAGRLERKVDVKVMAYQEAGEL